MVDVDVVAVGLGRDEQQRTVRREGDLAGCVDELGSGSGIEAQRPGGAAQGGDQAVYDLEAEDVAPIAAFRTYTKSR